MIADWYVIAIALASGALGAVVVLLLRELVKWATRLRNQRLYELECQEKSRADAEAIETASEQDRFRVQDKADCDLRCFYCGFAKYYHDKQVTELKLIPNAIELCLRCGKPVKWESAEEERARRNTKAEMETAVPTIGTGLVDVEGAAVPIKTTAPFGTCAICGQALTPPDNVTCGKQACIEAYAWALKHCDPLKHGDKTCPETTGQAGETPPMPTKPQGPCPTCGGRIVLGDLSFCRTCTKHIRPMPFVLDLQGAQLSKASIVDFARIVGWHRIACWTTHRNALLGMPDLESSWGHPKEIMAHLGDRDRQERGQKDILFGRPVRTTDYHPTDRLLSYDLAGDWTGQIINIGEPPEAKL